MATRTRGRRPAGSKTREAIIEAAHRQFGELGYRRTTLRSVGEAADVDPRLVLHYFGSKQRLFIESVQLPVEPEVLFTQLFEQGEGSPGERAARTVVAALQDEQARNVIVGLVRAAAAEPEVAPLIRQIITERLLEPVARRLGRDRPELRASLMASGVVGLAMARHVVGLEPLVAAPADELASALAPAFDHYLAGDLGRSSASVDPGG